LNLAMADGYIGSWETRYHHNFWRPITAIRMGDIDGNSDTEAVLDWTPLQWTYPIPDHDSGHAVQGGVAGEILTTSRSRHTARRWVPEAPARTRMP
jgi:hypothetical protein